MKNQRHCINIFLIVLVFIISGVQVIILNRDSTSGEKLTKIYREFDQVERENSRLSQQIASASAMVTLSVKAKRLGFVASQKFISLNSPQKLALSDRTSF